jgi:hypothetical protein
METKIPVQHLRSIEEAQDELSREMAARERIYPRWIAEGKILKSDAKDRLERHATAHYFLQKFAEAQKTVAEHCPGNG